MTLSKLVNVIHSYIDLMQIYIDVTIFSNFKLEKIFMYYSIQKKKKLA